MSDLLETLQRHTVDSSRPLSDALRFAMILASRLNNPVLRAWTQSELDGYQPGVSVPEYRIFSGQLTGHFQGIAGAAFRNTPIPRSSIASAIGAEATMKLFRVELRGSVAECEQLVKGGQNVRYQVSPDRVATFAHQIFEDFMCVQAWFDIMAARFAGLLDTVRNRLLDFVLELETTFGMEIRDDNWSSVPATSISQIFQNSVIGGNVAAGSANRQRK